MSMSSAGRVAVVSGANKGIGYFISLQLASSGLFDTIVLACRDVVLATKAAESMRVELMKKNPSNSSKISTAQLTIGETESHQKFVDLIDQTYGKVDCLINNAAILFSNHNSTTTPLQQTKMTLDVNFRGTIDFTQRMIPLVQRGSDPRIVNVSSTLGTLSQVSLELQHKFSSNTVTLADLHTLVDDFEASVTDGTLNKKGWSSSNYGISKLALIAATRVLARDYPGIAINSCNPGYCKTDMTNQMGLLPPSDGARNAVIPAIMENPPTGQFFSNYVIAKW